MSELILREKHQIEKGDYQSAGEASAGFKRKLKQLGIDASVLRRIAVASYEVELNLVIHSLGGTLVMEVAPNMVRLVSKDIGPGIADVEQAMREGYSTASEEARTLGFGAGMGLPNMKRNASTFNIESTKDIGTTIDMTFDLSAK